jgi:hypothetical protein
MNETVANFNADRVAFKYAHDFDKQQKGYTKG